MRDDELKPYKVKFTGNAKLKLDEDCIIYHAQETLLSILREVLSGTEVQITDLRLIKDEK